MHLPLPSDYPQQTRAKENSLLAPWKIGNMDLTWIYWYYLGNGHCFPLLPLSVEIFSCNTGRGLFAGHLHHSKAQQHICHGDHALVWLRCPTGTDTPWDTHKRTGKPRRWNKDYLWQGCHYFPIKAWARRAKFLPLTFSSTSVLDGVQVGINTRFYSQKCLAARSGKC